MTGDPPAVPRLRPCTHGIPSYSPRRVGRALSVVRLSRIQARKETMLKTPLCDLLGIDVPIILAPMGTCTSGEVAAAVSNNGGLGGVGSLFRTAAAIKRDIDVARKLTSRPFALNHIPQNLVPEAFDYALAARPAVMSFALAAPGNLALRALVAGPRITIQARHAA